MLHSCVFTNSALLACPAALEVQSQVEETLERIKVQPGVEGYVICNMDGQVLRRFPTMAQETAEMYAASMKHLTNKVKLQSTQFQLLIVAVNNSSALPCSRIATS